MNSSKDVDAFLASLDPDRMAQVSRLRALILGVQPGLTEHIKWNAPSYQWDGEDRITFNLQNKERLVRLVLHMGATTPENKKGKPVLDDETGLLAWQSDIRALLSFSGVDDIAAKQEPVKNLLTRWLALPANGFRSQRSVSASPETLFRTIEDPALLAQWWGPNGFSCTFETFEFRQDGAWKFVMHGPDGTNYPNECQFLEIRPAKVVIRHTVAPLFTATIDIQPAAGGCVVHWLQAFDDPEVAKAVAAVVAPSNEQLLDKLKKLAEGL